VFGSESERAGIASRREKRRGGPGRDEGRGGRPAIQEEQGERKRLSSIRMTAYERGGCIEIGGSAKDLVEGLLRLNRSNRS
jgi:hypothetical protein